MASCCRHNAMPAADAPSPATRDAQRRCACPKRAAVKEEAPKLECSFSGLDAAAVQPPAEYGLSVAGAFRAPAERTHRPPPCPIYLTHQALLV
ncbi:MAG: hypothetical protein HY291_05785 [Planctomycetes bacterium]|nr:hypothetical protein [Planctomycetota bacterium]